MNKQRAELHLHTTMSTMDGVNTAKDYINFALQEKMPAIAITDYACVQAFPEAYKAYNEVKRLHDPDFKFKLIYGNEIYMADDSTKASNKGETYHASILVINKIGLKNLYKLVSLANTQHFDKVPITPKSELEKYREGLLIGSGCDAGELYHAVRDKKSDDELIKIATFYDYLEIVPVGNFEYYIEQGDANDKEALIAINKKIIEIGTITGKSVVAVSDAHYVSEEDRICRNILMHYEGCDNYENQPLLSMRTTDEMLAEFDYLPEEKAYEIVVENTNKIANMVDAEILPIDHLNANAYEADIKELEDLVYKKMHEKYGENVPQEFLNRAEQELSVIGQIQENIFNILLSSELVKAAVEKGWTVGNRGSAASSYIAYLLGITEINPLDAHYYCPKCHYVEFHDEYSCGVDMEDKMCKCGEKLEKDGFTIPYETLFDTDGSRVIDIDLNFAPEYQAKAFENLKEITGLETVRCGTVNTISYKVVLAMINQHCKKEGIKLNRYQKKELADKLLKVKRSSGIHPGGVFVIPKGKEICDYTPLQYPANGDEWGYVTHFEYHDLPELLKIDILANDTPSMLRQLEELTGTKSKDIPLDDEKTMELFSERKTLGIPEFGTDYVRECVMDKVKTYSFDNLIRISSLSHGTDVWHENGENLIAEGKGLTDIVSCRDDVMLYLISHGIDRKEAYKISERIRKGKGLTEEQYDMLISEGVENWRLDSWNKIKYSFPRAHSASYVLLSYRIAYYKANFPLEFYCAYFNINADDFNPEILIDNEKELPKEIKKMEENKELSAWKQDLLMNMKVCQEMYDAGYKFVGGKAENKRIEGFCIEDGMIKPL